MRSTSSAGPTRSWSSRPPISARRTPCTPARRAVAWCTTSATSSRRVPRKAAGGGPLRPAARAFRRQKGASGEGTQAVPSSHDRGRGCRDDLRAGGGGRGAGGAAPGADARSETQSHRVVGHRRHRPRRHPVDGALPPVRRHVRRGGPRLVALGTGPPRAHPRGDRPLRPGLPGAEDALRALPGARRAPQRDEAGGDRRGCRQRASDARPRGPSGSCGARGGPILVPSGCSCGGASRTSPRRCTTRPTSCRSSASTSSAGRTRCGASTRTTTSRRTTPLSG